MTMTPFKLAAALVAASLPLAAPLAAQGTKADYERELSCAAYHLEIAGYYKSELGQDDPRSESLTEQYRQSGTAKVNEAMGYGAELGKGADEVKAELLALIERRITGNIQPGAQAELILAHVKNTTLKADTCQRRGN